MIEPLAFRVRPNSLNEIFGQEHLIGENKIITKMIENKRLFSMIFYGPPGCGKTTLATVIANSLNMPHKTFNAVTGNKKDLDSIFLQAKLSNGLVLIVDEIHRLNKDKQDLLLPHIEEGLITIIGATTANPFFSINPAIRSRCQIFEIKPLDEKAIEKTILRAMSLPEGLNNRLTIDDDALNLIAKKSNGDVRYALNLLDILSISTEENIDASLVKKYGNMNNVNTFKDGDGHYDILSAFQKSIRGSDVNAALYYLAVLIQSRDLDSIERRLLVIAYEDIGLANPSAIARCINAIDAAKRVGFPEASIPLSVAVIDLTLSPKSRSACEAIHSANDLVNESYYKIPDYLKLNPTNLNDDEKYKYDLKDTWPYIQYLPEQIKDIKFFKPCINSSYEKQLFENYKTLANIKKTSNLKKLNSIKHK